MPPIDTPPSRSCSLMFKQLKLIAAIGTASGIQVFLLALLSLLLAKFLPIEDFGITRTITAYMVILTMLGHFCLHDAVATYVASAEDTDKSIPYVVNGSYMTVAISIAVVIIAEIFILFSGLWQGKLRMTFAIITAYLPLLSLTTIFSSLLQATGSYRKLTIYLLLGGVVPLLVITPFTALWELGGWIFSRGLSCVILLAFSFFFIRHYFRFSKADSKVGRILFAFAKVQLVSGILSMVMQSADIIAIERFGGDMKQVAIYGLAALFGKSVMFLPGAVGRVFFKDIAEAKTRDKTIGGIKNLFLIIILLCAVIATALFFVVPVFIDLLYGAKYKNSIPVLRIMCFGIVFSGIWMALSVVNVALKQPKAAVAISTVGVIICLLSMFILVPRYGAVGAAWGMNIAYFGGASVGAWLLYRFLSHDMGKSPTY